MMGMFLVILASLQVWLLVATELALSLLSLPSLGVLLGCLALFSGFRFLLGRRGPRKPRVGGRVLRLLGVVLGNLSRNRKHFALAGIGIVVGIATFVFFIALGAGVRKIVLGEIFPIDQLEVVTPKVSVGVGPLQLENRGRGIDDAVVEEIRKIPGVKGVFPKMKIAFPARGWGGKSVFGENLGAEMIGDGIDPALVADDIKRQNTIFEDREGGPCQNNQDCGTGAFCGKKKVCEPRSCKKDADCGEGWYCDTGDPDWKDYVGTFTCHRPVPIFISTQLFELLNNTFLPANNLPKIDRDFFVGRISLSLYLGYSALGFADKGRPKLRRAVVAGFSSRAIPLGITIPLPYVKRWNKEYGGEDAARYYSSVLVEVESKDKVTAVAEAVKNDLDLAIEDSGAEQAGLIITIITLIFSLISVTIVGIAAINIMHTFFMLVSERRREIGILRSLGASRRDVRWLLLGEAAIVGAIAGVIGIFLGYDLTLLVDWINTTSLVPDFPFKPETYFSFSPLLVFGAFGFAVVCCLLGAYLPARAAAQIDPARALTAL